MDFIIDASSVINLDNAGALELVTKLRDHRFWVSPLVIGECEPTCAARLLKLQRDGALHFVDPNDISSETFLNLLSAHQLGEGETECISLCLKEPYVLCCDDNKARQLARRLLGDGRIIGTIGIIKKCVNSGLVSGADAVVVYEKMRAAGGFLPVIAPEWFSDGRD